MDVGIIELETLKEVAKQLKMMDSKWVSKLAKEIRKKDKRVNPQWVRNIYNNVLKTQADRRLFLTHALRMLEEIKHEQEEVLSKI